LRTKERREISIHSDRSQKLKSFVILTPGSSRGAYFKNNSQLEEFFEFEMLQAIMVNDESLDSFAGQYDPQSAKIIYGREFVSGEIGCALSHNMARSKVVEAGSGCLILEDDARIVDAKQLRDVADEFLIKMAGKAAVLTFFDGKQWGLNNYKDGSRKLWSHYLSPPGYAVAYVLTPEAAQKLVIANTPVKFVADWPFSSCDYFSCNDFLVQHGDESNQSTISGNSKSRARPALSRRLSILIGAHYFFNREYFKSFGVFFREVWLLRFKFYLDEIRFRYARLRKGGN
jgi:GR25 family glycosyltransferase involved in LPS biosynthesis